MDSYTKLSQRLDEISNRLIRGSEVPFLHILVEKNGKLIYDKVFGYRDATKQNKLQKDGIYRVASQTKAITSVAAMMLWEQGKFLLDEPLHKYIPSFKGAKVLDKFNESDGSYTTVPATREISIRDILSHTSGIGYSVFSEDQGMASIYGKTGVLTGIGSVGVLNQQVELMGPLPLSHQPGAKFTYGLNTDILGYLIEIWSGVSLSEYFETNIFNPLKMNDTSFRLPIEKKDRLIDLFQKDSVGFSKVTGPIMDGSPVNYPLAEGVYFSGGAGLVSTVYDYAKFLKIFTGKGVVDGQRFLGSRTIDMFSTNQLSEVAISYGDPFLRFGLGTALIDKDNNHTTPVSPGSLYWAGAFNTQYWVDPNQGIIALLYTQQYLPESYWNLGSIYKNVIYSQLED